MCKVTAFCAFDKIFSDFFDCNFVSAWLLGWYALLIGVVFLCSQSGSYVWRRLSSSAVPCSCAAVCAARKPWVVFTYSCFYYHFCIFILFLIDYAWFFECEWLALHSLCMSFDENELCFTINQYSYEKFLNALCFRFGVPGFESWVEGVFLPYAWRRVRADGVGVWHLAQRGVSFFHFFPIFLSFF